MPDRADPAQPGQKRNGPSIPQLLKERALQPSKIFRLTVLTVGVAAALGTTVPSFAQGSATPAAASSKVGPGTRLDQILESVASLNEDLVEFALAGKADKVADRLKEIEAAMPKLKPPLGEAAFGRVEAQVRDVQAAVGRQDLNAAALSSIEVYRLLQEAVDQKARPVPLDVALLDYSGFKLSALAAAPQPNWTAVNDAAAEADRFWKRLEPRVHDGSLRALVSHIGQGLTDGAARKDSGQVAFAAKMLLDSVDLLETDFTAKGK